MRFSIAAVLALATAVIAQDPDVPPTDGFDVVSKPGKNEKVPAGETYEIVWAPTAEYDGKTVSIILVGGETQNTQVVLDTLAEGVDSAAGSYEWAVDSSLGDKAVYGLKIRLEEDNNIYQWSNPFAITPTDDDHGDHSSSVPPSSSVASSTSYSVTSSVSKPSGYPTQSESSTFSSVYPSSNLSTTAPPPSSTPTDTPTATGTSTTSTSSTAATGAATAFAANGLAVMGGLAMAIFAL